MFQLHNEDETQAFGQALAQALGGQGLVYVQGDLGAGKTTLCRAIIRALGHTGAVKSPTFTLVEPYDLNGQQVFHLDLYRLADPKELEYIGIDEYFGADCLCLIEWPERAAGKLPQPDLTIKLSGIGTRRSVSLQSSSLHGEKVCLELEQHYGMA